MCPVAWRQVPLHHNPSTKTVLTGICRDQIDVHWFNDRLNIDERSCGKTITITRLNVGTWDYCGFKDITTRIFHEVGPETPETVLQAFLDEAQSLAADL
jgi:hypothetical protein